MNMSVKNGWISLEESATSLLRGITRSKHEQVVNIIHIQHLFQGI